MRRLYILLAAALIAATLIALGGSPASAERGHAKQYTALTYSPSTDISTVGDGSTLRSAEKKAYNHCQSVNTGDPNYQGDCQGAGWVQNGWIAVAREATYEGPPVQFGWGWDPTRGGAVNGAGSSCQQAAGESCVLLRGERTLSYNPAKPTNGGNW